MDKFDITVSDKRSYIAGYSVVRKEKCEVYNFVSHTFRVLRFLDGTVEWKIGENIDTFRKGDIVIFNNLIKRNIYRVLTKDITYELFDFLPSDLSSETLRNFFYSRTYRISSQDEKAIQKINFLLDELKSEIKNSKDSFQAFGIQKILDLLALAFYRNSKTHNPIPDATLENIAKAIRYIRLHYCDNLQVGQMARNFGYSPEYFSRTFKKYIGIPPVVYIINLRLENVLQLITNKHVTVLDAASQSGFHSSSAFYKAFHAYKLMSPSNYLKIKNTLNP